MARQGFRLQLQAGRSATSCVKLEHRASATRSGAARQTQGGSPALQHLLASMRAPSGTPRRTCKWYDKRSLFLAQCLCAHTAPHLQYCKSIFFTVASPNKNLIPKLLDQSPLLPGWILAVRKGCARLRLGQTSSMNWLLHLAFLRLWWVAAARAQSRFLQTALRVASCHLGGSCAPSATLRSARKASASGSMRPVGTAAPKAQMSSCSVSDS